MDNTNRDQLVAKAKILLTQARYAAPYDLFILDTVVNSAETPLEELTKICAMLEEHNNKQEQIFTEYKDKMKQTVVEFAKDLAKEQPQTTEPTTQSFPNTSNINTPPTVQYGSADATKQP